VEKRHGGKGGGTNLPDSETGTSWQPSSGGGVNGGGGGQERRGGSISHLGEQKKKEGDWSMQKGGARPGELKGESGKKWVGAQTPS